MKEVLFDILTVEPTQRNPFQPIQHQPYKDLKHVNIELTKAYTNIIKDLRVMLSRMAFVEHRTYLMCSYEVGQKYDESLLFEFVCSMCAITLYAKHYCYYIEFQTDTDVAKIIGAYNFRKMLRVVYRHTMYENTVNDLEDLITVYTDLADHYNYFKGRLCAAEHENGCVMVEDAIVE